MHHSPRRAPSRCARWPLCRCAQHARSGTAARLGCPATARGGAGVRHTRAARLHRTPAQRAARRALPRLGRGARLPRGAKRGLALLVAHSPVADLPARLGPHAHGACCDGAAARAARRSAGSERGRGGRGRVQRAFPWRLFQPRGGAEEPQRVSRGRTNGRARADWPAELREVRCACALDLSLSLRAVLTLCAVQRCSSNWWSTARCLRVRPSSTAALAVRAAPAGVCAVVAAPAFDASLFPFAQTT